MGGAGLFWPLTTGETRHGGREFLVLAMKYKVTRFKSLEVGLKELGPFILDGEHLQTGKPSKRFAGLRSSELLANWLLCVAVNSVSQPDRRLTFSSDPLGGDGIIYDSVTGRTWQTEHILVPRQPGDEAQDIEALILAAIDRKRSKGGAAYASGKTLVVFLNAGGGRNWLPNKVAEQLPEPLHFEAVWVVGLHNVEDGKYIYGVARLDLSRGNAPTWLVHIGKDFGAWDVEPIQ